MTTNTYGGYTVDQLREFIRHHYDAEHGGDNIDELTNDSSVSVKIVRDLLDAIEPQQDGDLLRPIARWVYNAVRVNLDLLHGICSDFGCPQGEDVATWLRARLAGVPAPCICSGLGPCEQRTDGSCRRDSAAVAAPADERAAFVRHQEYERPEIEGAAQEAWDYHRKTWIAALAFCARASSANETGAEGATWRELCRRLYVELFHCDQQMRSTRDEDGEPHWTQSSVVRNVLADAKAALEGAPSHHAQADARPTDDELWDQTLRERDEYHETADKLAVAIAKHFGVDIGEHSNANCPWEEALEVIENAAQADAREGLTERQRMDLLLVADDMEVSGDAKLADALRALLASHPGRQEPRASAGVIAAALAVIEADRAQTLTTEHIDALDNAIKIQRGELTPPEPRAEMTDDDKVCADRYRYLRRFVRGVRNFGAYTEGFAFPEVKPVGNVMQGSVAEHLDDAIDSARAGGKQ
ncbi:hypothetical protein [Burkholderia vietnamiensis]|uniref:hypothetical protein n=1 Tax=Burkholderia vietnamiensis TaxID=60552 RepID=UPI001D13E5C9|nr:hypothetical protein [Burkholderia vietnamiensis]UEC01199.1 hypothetical protein LK462_21795 [Burkholderia vietnamiensis]